VFTIQKSSVSGTPEVETGDPEFKTSLGYIGKPCLKNPKEKSEISDVLCLGLNRIFLLSLLLLLLLMILGFELRAFTLNYSTSPFL
jgi:hypothetical protein